MGNAPSKEVQGRPSHKLSKPRVTSLHTAALPISSPQKAAPIISTAPDVDFMSIPYSSILSNTETISADTHDPDDSRWNSDKPTGLAASSLQRRLSLFRSRSSRDPSDRRTSRRNTIIGAPNLLVQGDLDVMVSRANVVSAYQPSDQWHRGLPLPVNESWPLAENRASWACDLAAYEAQRLLSEPQLERQQLRRSQTFQVSSRPDLTTIRPASMFVQPESAPISRSTSEVSLHPPMRRRSMLQTPGVATRPRLTPAPARSTRSSMRHSHPPTPNMSRQPSMHFEQSEKHMSLPPLPTSGVMHGGIPRAPTPTDTDYSITGAFKFGSLRITNGSPVTTSHPGPCHGEDTEQPKSAIQSDIYFAVGSHHAETTSSGPVLRPTAQMHVLVADPSGNTKHCPQECGGEVLPGQPPSHHGCRLDSQGASGPLFDLRMTQDPPFSPLMTQSKQTAVDDDLFDDDTEVSVPEVLDVRVDLHARSFLLQPTESTEVLKGVDRSDSGFLSDLKSTASKSRSSLAKADSGYSSNVSVRSLRHGKGLASSEEGVGRSPTPNGRVTCGDENPVTERMFEVQVPDLQDRAVDPTKSEKALTPPPKDGSILEHKSQVSSQMNNNTSATPNASGTTGEQFLDPRPTAIDISQRLERPDFVSPKSLPLSSASAHSDNSSSSLSIGNNVQKPGRLHRLLSLGTSRFSKQPYTMHVTHCVDGKIPSIPKEVEAKLQEHTGLRPTTTSRLAVKTQKSRETLKTILSVGSLECVKDDYTPLPQTFVEEDEQDNSDKSGDAKDENPKNTLSSLQSMPSTLKTATLSMMFSRKQTARTSALIRETGTDATGRDARTLRMEQKRTSYVSTTSTWSSSSHDSDAHRLSPARRSRRTMSVNHDYSHRSQMRTYSLLSSSVPDTTSLSSSTCAGGQVSPNCKTFSQTSMVTYTSFRTPPPRPPMRPQGPAIMPSDSQENVPKPMNHAAVLVAGRQRLKNRVASGNRPLESTSASQVHSSAWTPPSRQNSQSSRMPPSAHSRHNSISSVLSDRVRNSQGFQTDGQHNSALLLKHRSSLDGVDRSQLRGAYVAHAAHQGPISQYSYPCDWSSAPSHPNNDVLQSWGPPPYVPRGTRRRNLSVGNQSSHLHTGGDQAPYRILHSYNSPAYRNVPIWG